MRKLINRGKLVIAILGLGLFSMANAEPVNAEPVIGMGTLSIEQFKDAITKLIQDDTAQSQRIAYLTQQLANLESQVAKLAEQTNKLAKKVASMTPHHYHHYTRHDRDEDRVRHVRHERKHERDERVKHEHASRSAELKTEHCTEKSCPMPHLKKETSYCVTTNLNVHEGPGLNYKVVGMLRKGIIVSTMAEQDGWVEIPSPSGWVNASYLKECGHGRNEK